MPESMCCKTLRHRQKEHISEVLEATNSNLNQAARALDISEGKLLRYIKEFEIDICIR